ncbi:larval cuticle protein LCP-17-like isoform X2 [Bicyclus anynana]|uniref:Larval cuticle protein LCP-17-like isoform X2 n=1 Tax=Bicyclus anynana TaxID=110368 RepID=A0ABM3LQT6_BICAN|nr:larval cuticle protein LCP-17-like isoform X2 [Bicyclus anynana]
MKFLIVLAVVAFAAADVSHVVNPDYQVPIVKSTYDISPEGQAFQYAYETGNNIYAQVEGDVKNFNSDQPTLQVRGSYKYTAPDGTPVETVYTADENGFLAQGSHIPVAPPIPELIQRSLDYIAAHPPVVEKVYKP